MTVLNSNRVIDSCGNTTSNPYAKKSSITQVEQKPLTDLEKNITIGVLSIISILVIMLVVMIVYKIQK